MQDRVPAGPSLEQIAKYWAERGERYGPERVGASFSWMKSFASVEEAKAKYDVQEDALQTHSMKFIDYIREVTGLRRRLTVLEEGVGPGNLTVRLASLEDEFLVSGIDLCFSLLDYNRARLRNAGLYSAANRMHYGIAQALRPTSRFRRHCPPPKFYEDNSQDVIIWGRLDHRLLGDYYTALGQAIDVLTENGLLIVFSFSKWENEGASKPNLLRFHWARDEDDYMYVSELRKAHGRSYIEPVGERWQHRHCDQNYFFRAWKKCSYGRASEPCPPLLFYIHYRVCLKRELPIKLPWSIKPFLIV